MWGESGECFEWMDHSVDPDHYHSDRMILTERLRKSEVKSFVRTPDSRTPHTCLPGGSIWARRRKWVWYDDEISDEPVRRRTMVWGLLVVNINHYSVFITLTLRLWAVPGCGVWCQHNQVITSCCSYTGNGRSRDTSLLSPCVEQSVWSREEQEGTPITGNGTEYWAQREQSIIFLPRRGNLITNRSSTHCLAKPYHWHDN